MEKKHQLLEGRVVCAHLVVDKHWEDYSTAGWLKCLVYRDHSTGERKHAKAKKSHVQRAGLSLSTMTQQPLNLFNTRGLQPEWALCSSQELSKAKYLLCCSALHSQSLLSHMEIFFSFFSFFFLSPCMVLMVLKSAAELTVSAFHT